VLSLVASVEELDLCAAKVIQLGKGDAGVPHLQLRAGSILQPTDGRTAHESEAVRLFCANKHPNHDTNSAFAGGTIYFEKGLRLGHRTDGALPDTANGRNYPGHRRTQSAG